MRRETSGRHKAESNPEGLIHGNSRMAEVIRTHDWSLTLLGPIEDWSENLLFSANLMLACAFPSLVFWGEELVQLYNDAFIPLLAERHPSGLGQTAQECWWDAWQIVGPNLKRVMNDGESVFHENTVVPIVRDGRLQDIRWTYSYSPIDDDTAPSGIGGVLVICTETTQKVIEEQRLSGALRAGQLVHWETDLITGTRTWTQEAMALFGLSLVDGRGHFGGDADEFRLALHSEDRYLADGFYELADKQDWFPVEYRIRRPDGTVRWLSGGGQVLARSAEGKAQRLINVVADVSERKIAEERIKFLMGEIIHRSKNLLSVVQAIASQTGRTVDTFEEFQKRFTQRLQGLAASHDLLVLRDSRCRLLCRCRSCDP